MTANGKTGAGAAARRTRNVMLVLMTLLLRPTPLGAADAEMSQEYAGCIDKSNGVTSEMLDCMKLELTRQDARLNENYRRLMATLSAKRKKGLLEAQRAWMRFRDANCSFYHDPEGGSAAHLAGNECFLDATAHRATELRNLTKER